MAEEFNFKNLYEFIDRAQHNRNYSPNTATSFRTPLRLIESELNDDEKTSIEIFKKNIDQIYNLLFSKNNTRFSASTIEVYKRRTRKLLSDYEKYGNDPGSMANWNRPQIAKKIKKAQQNSTDKEHSTSDKLSFDEQHKDKISEDVQSVILSLTNGNASLTVPKDFPKKDADKLKSQIDIFTSDAG